MTTEKKRKAPRKPQEKYTVPGRRVMDVAYLRDGDSEHTGEALVLACLLHAKGKTNRADNEVKKVGEMLNDPNLDKRNPHR